FQSAAADDDHRLQQLGTADQSEQRVLGEIEIGLHAVGFERAMLQEIAQLSQSVRGLARRVLHRVAHYLAVYISGSECSDLAIQRQQETGERQVDRHRALRKLIGPQ